MKNYDKQYWMACFPFFHSSILRITLKKCTEKDASRQRTFIHLIEIAWVFALGIIAAIIMMFNFLNYTSKILIVVLVAMQSLIVMNVNLISIQKKIDEEKL